MYNRLPEDIPSVSKHIKDKFKDENINLGNVHFVRLYCLIVYNAQYKNHKKMTHNIFIIYNFALLLFFILILVSYCYNLLFCIKISLIVSSFWNDLVPCTLVLILVYMMIIMYVNLNSLYRGKTEALQ